MLIGGTGDDAIDGGIGRDMIFGDNASVDRTTTAGISADPRFRQLTGSAIYSTAEGTAGNVLVSAAPPSRSGLDRTSLSGHQNAPVVSPRLSLLVMTRAQANDLHAQFGKSLPVTVIPPLVPVAKPDATAAAASLPCWKAASALSC